MEKEKVLREYYNASELDKIEREVILDKTVAELTKDRNGENTLAFINLVNISKAIKNNCEEQKKSQRSLLGKLSKKLIDCIYNFPINELFEDFVITKDGTTIVKIKTDRTFNEDDEYNIRTIFGDPEKDPTVKIQLRRVEPNLTTLSFTYYTKGKNPYVYLKNAADAIYRNSMFGGIPSGDYIVKLNEFKDKTLSFYKEFEKEYNNLMSKLNDYFVVMDELLTYDSQ